MWTWIVWDRNGSDAAFKSHACPNELVPALLAESYQRGYTKTSKLEPLDEWHVDFGGSIIVNEPIELMIVDGLAISAWSIDVGSGELLGRLRNKTQPRRFVDGPWYYKMHTWNHCIVMTGAHRAMLITALVERKEAAKKRYDDFFAEWKRRNPPKVVAS